MREEKMAELVRLVSVVGEDEILKGIVFLAERLTRTTRVSMLVFKSCILV